MCPDLQMDEKSGINKMEWDPDNPKNDQRTKIFIVRLGKLLAHLRGVVPTFHTDDISSQGLGYSYALSTIEDPRRAMTQLRNLARGHAFHKDKLHDYGRYTSAYQCRIFNRIKRKSKNL